ncbi:glycosyltransferase [Streptomyces sp. T-3]|nr:glycosyltransferase [Streptomyces sp. T-3]
MKITFLLHNAYTIGAAVRATTNLAGALAARHKVEIVSFYRTADRMPLTVAEDVKVRTLVDLRPTSRHFAGTLADQQLPGATCPHDTVYAGPTPPSRLGEDRLAAHLRSSDADVVLATRPYLVCFLTEHGRTESLRIGQEYTTADAHSAALRDELDAAIARLDAYVTPTRAAAHALRGALPDASARLADIPVCSPAPAAEPSTSNSRLVVAAGRLTPMKRYDRLVDAFADVVAVHPDWSLRIYGRGRERERLQRRVEELGLHNNVLVMGARTPMDPEWAKGAIAVVPDTTESTGMSLVEAMSCGLPVVSTDCDHAPREVITPGEDGLLVPDHGSLRDTLAAAIRHLIENEAERRRMAGAARRSSERFRPERIAARYEALFTDLNPSLAAGRRSSRHVGDGVRWRRRGRLLAERLHPVGFPRSLTVNCRATTDGSLVFELPTRHLPPGVWNLVLRPRDPESAEPLRLPVDRDAADDTQCLRFTLDRRHRELAEGDWDVLLTRFGGTMSRPVKAGLIETAHLLESAPLQSSWREGGKTWIPYAAPSGGLAVRARSRPRHAEVATVDTDGNALQLTGRLLGPNPRAHHYRFQARLPGETTWVFGSLCHVDQDGRFTIVVPTSLVAGHHLGGESVWELFLGAYGGPAVRLGMVTGDLVDLRHIRRFPTARRTGPGGELVLHPQLTRDHDLVLRATTEPTGSPRDQF